MTKNLFLKKTDELPALYMDMVFVESVRPILFTCTDESDQLYICSCCYASGNKCVWIVADTTPGDIISLLRNECEIWDVFGNNERVAVVTKYSGAEHPQIQFFDLQDVPEALLPTKGYSMEAEEGEFEDELEELQSRLDESYEYETLFEHISFYTIIRMIYASVKPNISVGVPVDEFWNNDSQAVIVLEANV